jgi:hypothetical protein
VSHLDPSRTITNRYPYPLLSYPNWGYSPPRATSS